MTFSEIVSAVQDRLNLTSSTSTTRIGIAVNDRFRRASSSIGLNLTRRGTATAASVVGINTMTFNLEKIENVVNRGTSPYTVLDEEPPEELRNDEPFSRATPKRYAIISVGASTTTILMDAIPTAAAKFTLTADGYINSSTLSGSMVPIFPADFHDILLHGALADEYLKLEKFNFAQDSEARYERRLSDLRMFLAKSAYVDLHQGKTATFKDFPWLNRSST